MTLDHIIPVVKHEAAINSIERIGAERNIIAYVLNDPESIFDVSVSLKEEDFCNTINKEVFFYMSELMKAGKAVSQTNISAMLRRNGRVSADEIDNYLDIIGKTSTLSMDLDHNVELVKTASVKRHLYREALEIQRECLNDKYDEPSGAIMGKAQNRVITLGIKHNSGDQVVNLGDTIFDHVRALAENPGGVKGLLTGLPELDVELGGLAPGTLTILGARGKVGKSALKMGWSANWSIPPIDNIDKDVADVLFIDTEMSREQVNDRLLSRVSGVDIRSIKSGLFTANKEELERVQLAAKAISKGRFHHIRMPGFSIGRIAALARKYKIQHDIKALVFDYIKLDDEGAASARTDIAMGKIANGLKELGGELEIPVVSSGQLNQKAIGVGEDELHAGMMRNSDELLHFCDHMIFLINKPEAKLKAEAEAGIALGNQVLKIIESRHGASYTGYLHYHGNFMYHEEVVRVL